MKKLLDITRNGGYPLCAETLELLHDNVQLLETVLNGLKLPQHTIVRFPYGDYAYVQSCNPEDGNGEILKITSGNSLLNSNVNYYTITSTQQSVTNANNSTFNNVYEMRSLNLQHINFVPPGYIVKVYNCDEVFQLGLFRESNMLSIKYSQSGQEYIASQYVTVISGEYAKYNEKELRLRAILDVTDLPIAADTELIIKYGGGITSLNLNGNVIPTIVSVNSNGNYINRHVNADIVRHDNTHYLLKIMMHEISDICAQFTGIITISSICAL